MRSLIPRHRYRADVNAIPSEEPSGASGSFISGNGIHQMSVHPKHRPASWRIRKANLQSGHRAGSHATAPTASGSSPWALSAIRPAMLVPEPTQNCIAVQGPAEIGPQIGDPGEGQPVRKLMTAYYGDQCPAVLKPECPVLPVGECQDTRQFPSTLISITP